jgi:hypothetical protein
VGIAEPAIVGGIRFPAVDDVANGKDGKREHRLPLTPQQLLEDRADVPAASPRSQDR